MIDGQRDERVGLHVAEEVVAGEGAQRRVLRQGDGARVAEHVEQRALEGQQPGQGDDEARDAHDLVQHAVEQADQRVRRRWRRPSPPAVTGRG